MSWPPGTLEPVITTPQPCTSLMSLPTRRHVTSVAAPLIVGGKIVVYPPPVPRPVEQRSSMFRSRSIP